MGLTQGYNPQSIKRSTGKIVHCTEKTRKKETEAAGESASCGRTGEDKPGCTGTQRPSRCWHITSSRCGGRGAATAAASAASGHLAKLNIASVHTPTALPFYLPLAHLYCPWSHIGRLQSLWMGEVGGGGFMEVPSG